MSSLIYMYLVVVVVGCVETAENVACASVVWRILAVYIVRFGHGDGGYGTVGLGG